MRAIIRLLLRGYTDRGMQHCMHYKTVGTLVTMNVITEASAEDTQLQAGWLVCSADASFLLSRFWHRLLTAFVLILCYGWLS